MKTFLIAYTEKIVIMKINIKNSCATHSYNSVVFILDIYFLYMVYILESFPIV